MTIIEPKSPRASISLHDVGASLGAMATITFVASVFYDWGFLSALGLSFQDVPTTLSDHTRSALTWLPAGAAAVLLMVAQQLATAGLMPNPPLTAKTMQKHRRTATIVVCGVMAIMLLGFLAHWLLNGDAAMNELMLFLGLSWFLLCGFSTSRIPILMKLPFSVRFAAALLPTLMMLLFSFGYQNGMQSFKNPKMKAQLAGGQSADSALVLRLYENGVLYRINERVAYAPWSQVQGLQALYDREFWQGLRCGYRGCTDGDE